MGRQIIITFPTKTFSYPLNSFLVFTLLETQQKLPNFLPSSLFPLWLLRFCSLFYRIWLLWWTWQAQNHNHCSTVQKNASSAISPIVLFSTRLPNCWLCFPSFPPVLKFGSPNFIFSFFLPFSLSTVNLCSSPGEVWQSQFHTTSNFLCRSTQSP